MQWYKHYLADYQQDTADLNLTQQGAYRALLDAYYQREGPLPSDLTTLYRIVKAHTRAEHEAVRIVLNRFFDTKNGHVFNTRADQEIVKYQAQCSANRRPNRVQNLEREIDNPLTPLDKPVDNCQQVLEDGKLCGKPGVSKKHPRSSKWYCREHG